jgi:hypothetical protein
MRRRQGASRAEKQFGFPPKCLKSPNSWNTFALIRLPPALLRLPRPLAEFPLAWTVVQRGARFHSAPRSRRPERPSRGEIRPVPADGSRQFSSRTHHAAPFHPVDRSAASRRTAWAGRSSSRHSATGTFVRSRVGAANSRRSQPFGGKSVPKRHCISDALRQIHRAEKQGVFA